MPSDGTHLALLAVRDNALLAREFTGDLTVQEFKADQRTFYAVTRCLEIVSEAARRLSPALRARHPELPWRAIMGVGNIYRHDYDKVVEEFVWQTVHHSLVPLLAAVATELAGLQDGGR